MLVRETERLKKWGKNLSYFARTSYSLTGNSKAISPERKGQCGWLLGQEFRRRRLEIAPLRKKTPEEMLGKEIERLKSGKDWQETLNYSGASKDEEKSAAFLLSLEIFRPFFPEEKSCGCCKWPVPQYKVCSALISIFRTPCRQRGPLLLPLFLVSEVRLFAELNISTLLFFFASWDEKNAFSCLDWLGSVL